MDGFHLYLREDFNIALDDLPEKFYFLFGDQLQRARAVLAGRSAKQIAYAVDSLDWMLRDAAPHFMAQILEVLETKNDQFLNRAKALRACQPHFDITEQPDLPDATWAEYFAALALACMAESLYAALHSEPPLIHPLVPETPAPPPEQITYAEFGSALEAMDAVCFSEHLLTEAQARPQPVSDQEHSTGAPVPLPPINDAAARGRKGGKVRNAKFGALKHRVIDLYEEKYKDSPSNRQAARQIFNEIRDEVLAVLSENDPVGRLAKWIGEHRNEQKQKTEQMFFLSPIGLANTKKRKKKKPRKRSS
jgi:hypothetical protein